MIKYFQLLLDLLEVDEAKRDLYTDIAKKIEFIPDSNLICYHRYAFVFEWYQKLIKWEITEDEFTQLWDFKSQSLLDIQKKDSISFLKSNPNLDSNTLYIFDALAKWIVEESENIFYC